jgi:hypothetical protein
MLAWLESSASHTARARSQDVRVNDQAHKPCVSHGISICGLEPTSRCLITSHSPGVTAGGLCFHMLGVCRSGCVASASVVSASCSSCQILRSCTAIVRIIPLTPTPGTMSPSHHALEGGMPWCCIMFSLVDSLCPPMALHPVTPHLVQTRRDPAPRARPAHHAQAPAFSRAQSMRGADAQTALCVV